MGELVPGRYVWKIKDVCLCPVGGCISSPIYKTGCVEWKVRLFTLNLSTELRLSFRMEWEGKTSGGYTIREIAAKIDMFLLYGKNGKFNICKVSEKRQSSNLRFFQNFDIAKNDFLAYYLVDDGLTCSIEVGFCYCVSGSLAFNIPSNLESLHADLTAHLLKQPTDVKLQSDDGVKEFSAHRQLLSARSEVFQKMLSADMLEKRNGIVRLPDLNSSELQELVNFLYGREVNPAHLNSNVYRAAHKYGLPNLQRLCSRELVSKLSVASVSAVAVVASLHSDTELFSAVKQFIVDNAAAVVVSSSYVELLQQSPDVARQLVGKAGGQK